jgi:pSer/pThr/pTyr-binding forkhead associated (FHA) protein
MSDNYAPLARLTVKRSGVLTSQVFEFRPPAVIGRFDPSVGPVDVDLGPLPEGAYVSRRHARISWEDGVWRLEDLGSSNGTFILRDDFERIEDEPLATGSEIALGNARLVFETLEAEVEAPAPDSDFEGTEPIPEAAESAQPESDGG